MEQARDIVRKLYKVSRSNEVSQEDREKVSRFIDKTSTEVSVGFWG